jgi:hypothetical protein
MKLKKSQKEKLLEWVAAGLKTDEINKLAQQFSLPFQVSRAQVDFYRKTRGADIKQLAQASEFDALSSVLAQKSERVKRLQLLASLMEEDIFAGAQWLTDYKSVGRGEDFQLFEIERFNQSEISEYRATLEQIAAEVGDAETNINIRGKLTVTFRKADGQT